MRLRLNISTAPITTKTNICRVSVVPAAPRIVHPEPSNHEAQRTGSDSSAHHRRDRQRRMGFRSRRSRCTAGVHRPNPTARPTELLTREADAVCQRARSAFLPKVRETGIGSTVQRRISSVNDLTPEQLQVMCPVVFGDHDWWSPEQPVLMTYHIETKAHVSDTYGRVCRRCNLAETYEVTHPTVNPQA